MSTPDQHPLHAVYVAGWMAARMSYGGHTDREDADVLHGAECDRLIDPTVPCCCNPDEERADAAAGADRFMADLGEAATAAVELLRAWVLYDGVSKDGDLDAHLTLVAVVLGTRADADHHAGRLNLKRLAERGSLEPFGVVRVSGEATPVLHGR